MLVSIMSFVAWTCIVRSTTVYTVQHNTIQRMWECAYKDYVVVVGYTLRKKSTEKDIRHPKVGA